MRREVMSCRKDGDFLMRLPVRLPGKGINERDGFNLCIKECYPNDMVVCIDREDIDCVSPHTEGSPDKICVIALVVHRNKRAHNIASLEGRILNADGNALFAVFLRRPKPVNARHGRYNNDIVSGQHVMGGGVPQAVYFFVNFGFFFNIGVGLGNVCLRLVVVVVGDKVMDGVFRKKFFKFACQLCGKCFIMGDDKSWLLQCLDNMRHGKRFAGAGNAQKRLMMHSCFHVLNQRLDGARLVACGRERRFERECLGLGNGGRFLFHTLGIYHR